MKVKISVVQPKSFRKEREPENVERALGYIDEAVAQGAQIICFPEMYPGPANPANDYDCGEIAAKAREHKVYIIKGRIRKERSDDKPWHSVCADLLGPEGQTIGTYKRTEPLTSHVYKDIDAWGFDYLQFDELPVFETEFGKIAVLICSEVYAPELARIVAMKGAEVCFFPAGALINELMPTWKTMVWARAIENLMYTAACQGLYGVEEGVAMIASPEEVLIESGREGVLVAKADLDRVRWLREQEQKIEIPKQYRVIPGLLRWRRPAMYRKNYADW